MGLINHKHLRIVIDSLQLGGTEKHLSSYLPVLAAKGWKIKIIVLRSMYSEALLQEIQQSGITIYFLDATKSNRFKNRFFSTVLSMWRLWCDFCKDRKSITHFFLPRAYLLGALADLLAFSSVSKIMSRRSMNYYQKNKKGSHWLERIAHYRMDYILANSQKVLDQLSEEEGVPQKKIKLIYNGVDLSKYTVNKLTQIRPSLNIDPSSLVLIMIANLLPYKGHTDLLKALKLIQNQLPDSWYLLCVGRDENLLSSLKQLANDLNLENHVRWLGACNEIPELLSASDIGLLCSHEEGFSNAILEGMASALPMIVTDVGGNAEAVIHGKTGLVVPSRDLEALSQAILQLSHDASLRSSMGKAGYQRALEYFSLTTCVSHYQHLYETIALHRGT